ncbi:hypothetical protein [Enterobacter hormaechei]|uniref:hypothetical protein n=1 Tax=Enterobacter hormaechei TaxID=158836 RepID=UPI003D6E1274
MIEIHEVGDILLRSCNSSFSPKKHAIEMGKTPVKQQTFNKLAGVHVVDVIGKNNEDSKICFYRVLCGLRLLVDNDDDKEEIDFELRAEFDVPFNASNDVSQPEIEANSDNSLIMASVWPYWKELIQSICLKSGIKPLKIPDYTPLQKSKLVEIDN